MKHKEIYIVKILIAVAMPLVLLFVMTNFVGAVSYRDSLTESNYYEGEKPYDTDGIMFDHQPQESGTIYYSIDNSQCLTRVYDDDFGDRGEWRASGQYDFPAPDPYLYFMHVIYDIIPTEDFIPEGNHSCSITFSIISDDPELDGFSETHTYEIRDNDVPEDGFTIVAPEVLEERDNPYENVYEFSVFGTDEPAGSTEIWYESTSKWCGLKYENDGFMVPGRFGRLGPFIPHKWQERVYRKIDIGIGFIIVVGNDDVYTPDKECVLKFEVRTNIYDENYSNVTIPDLIIPIIDDDAPTSNTTGESSSSPETDANTGNNAEQKLLSDLKVSKVDVNGVVVEADGEVLEVSGSEITVSGSAKPNQTLLITLYSDPVSATVAADDEGFWSHTFTDIPEGDHRVEIQDPEDTSSAVVIANIKVMAADTKALSGIGDDIGSNVRYLVMGILALVASLIGVLLIKSKMKPIKYVRHLFHHR